MSFILAGLQAKPELNGCECVVGAYNADKGRYNVRLKSKPAVACLDVALKPENLEQAAASRLPPACCEA